MEKFKIYTENLLKNSANKIIPQFEVTGAQAGYAKIASSAVQRGLPVRTLTFAESKLNKQDVKSLCYALTVNMSITELEMQRCELPSNIGREIASLVKKSTVLEGLCISSTDFNHAAGMLLSEVIREASEDRALRAIELDHCDLSDDCVNAIGANLGRVEIFSCENNSLQEVCLTGPFKVSLCTNMFLKILHMSDNYLGDAGAVTLAEILKVNKSVTSLWIEHNEIGPTGGLAIANMLSVNTTLEILLMGQNPLGEESFLEIGEALHSNTSLKELFLHETGMGDDGAREIARSLVANSTLRWLNLCRNNLTCRSAGMFATALSMNKSLVTLDMSFNDIRCRGAEFFAGMLDFNSTLRELSLNNTMILEIGLTALLEAIERSVSFVDISVDHDILPDLAARVTAAAKMNLDRQGDISRKVKSFMTATGLCILGRSQPFFDPRLALSRVLGERLEAAVLLASLRNGH